MVNCGKVSVIIPVYNAEKYIQETINSVKKQTYTNWEIILVDDSSTDKSVAIINKNADKKIKLLRNYANLGPALSRNRGIDIATGRFIAFLDADDLWLPEKLEKQIEHIANNDASFSFTGYQFADESGDPNGKIVDVPDTIMYKQALKNTTISTITVMFDMKSLTKTQIKMPDVPSEDTATWWKLLRSDVKVAFGLDLPLSIYRRTSDTLTSNKITAVKRTWNLYRKLEGFFVLKAIYYFVFYCINAVRRRI